MSGAGGLDAAGGAGGRNETAWDLDAPLNDEPRPGLHSGLVSVLAIGIAGLGLGGLTGSVLTPSGAPRLPPAATLTARDFYVDLAAGTPPSPGADPNSSSPPRVSTAVVVFRLRVNNPADTAVRVTSLQVEGATRARSVLPLNLSVAAHRSAVVDLTLSPDCSTGRRPVPVRARLQLDQAGSDPVLVSPSPDLGRDGGLCQSLDTELPGGWRTPLEADSTRLDEGDLEISIDSLTAEQLAGGLIKQQVVPTVFIGDQLLSTSIQARPGEPIELRLHGPPPCIEFTGPTPIPTTLRMLVQGPSGTEQRLVVVGPDLTHWLRLDCD
jgi:hypothetical protein